MGGRGSGVEQDSTMGRWIIRMEMEEDGVGWGL